MQVEEPKPKLVPLSKINRDHSTQTRVKLDPNKVEEYTAIIQEFGPMDPIKLYNPGPDVELYFIGQGYHRIAATEAAGLEKIPALIYPGGESEAILCSFDNGRNGLPFSNADKRRAAKMAVEDPKIGKLDDKKIAKKIGVSVSLVAEVRKGITPADKKTIKEKKEKAKEPVTMLGPTENPESPIPVPMEPASLRPVSTRERKAKEDDSLDALSKKQIERQIKDWLLKDKLADEDLVKILSSGVGDYKLCPKKGGMVNIHVKGPKDSQCAFVAKVDSIEFGEWSVKTDAKLTVSE